MTIETLSVRTVLKWAALATAFVTVFVMLCADTMGFALAPFVFAHLWWFRPPKAQLTDADLDALLGRS